MMEGSSRSGALPCAMATYIRHVVVYVNTDIITNCYGHRPYPRSRPYGRHSHAWFADCSQNLSSARHPSQVPVPQRNAPGTLQPMQKMRPRDAPPRARNHPTERPMTTLPATTPPSGTEADAPATPALRGRTRRAVDLMVWQGVPFDDAAAQCGLKRRSLQNAFLLPSVKAYYAAQLQVLREGHRARNIYRLAEIRDAANNMPAVNAIKALEQLDDAAAGTSAMQRSPGLQIVITQSASPPLPHATPLELEASIPPVPQRQRD